MMKRQDTFTDAELREALRSLYGEVPAIPGDFAEKVMARIEPTTKDSRRRRRKRILTAVAAGLAVAAALMPVILTEGDSHREQVPTERHNSSATGIIAMTKQAVEHEEPAKENVALAEEPPAHHPTRPRPSRHEVTAAAPSMATYGEPAPFPAEWREESAEMLERRFAASEAETATLRERLLAENLTMTTCKQLPTI